MDMGDLMARQYIIAHAGSFITHPTVQGARDAIARHADQQMARTGQYHSMLILKVEVVENFFPTPDPELCDVA